MMLMFLGASFIATLAVTASLINARKLRVFKAQYAHELIELKKDLGVVSSGAIGVGQRILLLEKRLAQLDDGSDMKVSEQAGFSYSQAIEMFEQGMDTALVASSCGLSQSEAALMKLVQKQDDYASA